MEKQDDHLNYTRSKLRTKLLSRRIPDNGHGPVRSSAKDKVRLEVLHGHSHGRTTDATAPSGSTDTELS